MFHIYTNTITIKHLHIFFYIKRSTYFTITRLFLIDLFISDVAHCRRTRGDLDHKDARRNRRAYRPTSPT